MKLMLMANLCLVYTVTVRYEVIPLIHISPPGVSTTRQQYHTQSQTGWYSLSGLERHATYPPASCRGQRSPPNPLTLRITVKAPNLQSGSHLPNSQHPALHPFHASHQPRIVQGLLDLVYPLDSAAPVPCPGEGLRCSASRS